MKYTIIVLLGISFIIFMYAFYQPVKKADANPKVDYAEFVKLENRFNQLIKSNYVEEGGLIEYTEIKKKHPYSDNWFLINEYLYSDEKIERMRLFEQAPEPEEGYYLKNAILDGEYIEFTFSQNLTFTPKL